MENISQTTNIIDARPFLLRNKENIWDRTEQLRTNLYELIEEKCRVLKVEALVLQSGPYEHPAWVKFESWFPSENKAITLRSSMTVTIYTKPFHQFESIYFLDWHKLGYDGKVVEIYKFGEKEVGEIIDFLCLFDNRLIWHGQVNSIFKSVQLRQKWYQILKPKNKIKSLRFDWIFPGSIAMVIIGVVLVTASLNSNELVSYNDTTFENSFEFESDLLQEENNEMEIEEGIIPIDKRVIGFLEDSDLKFEDEKFYDMWWFSAEIGNEYSISMISEEFDTQLFLYEIINEDYVLVDSNDDVTDNDSNSLINFVAPDSKKFMVIASSFEPKELGLYNLLIQKK